MQNFIDVESEFVDLNYKVASLIFCHAKQDKLHTQFILKV